jgi:hypothetical protein
VSLLTVAPLTCHEAYSFAKKDMPCKFYRTEIDLIKGFLVEPPKEWNDEAWSCAVLAYYMCLGMAKKNAALALAIMDDSGVNQDSMEWTLLKAGFKRDASSGFEVMQTNEPIAPPTFKPVANTYLDRGYEVTKDLKPGDVCIFENFVGFFHQNGEGSLYICGGFTMGSLGLATVEDKTLTKIIRI